MKRRSAARVNQWFCRAAGLIMTMTVAAGAGAEETELLDPQVRTLLQEELSGEIAKDHVYAITRYHRTQGSRGYRQAAEYVLAQLRELGFGEEDAGIESFPTDGKVFYQTWQSPPGWDISSAELSMVEPRRQWLARYEEIAASVAVYSNPGEVTTELVWVGSGSSDSDYEDLDVTGKLVLTTGYPSEVHRQAVLERGAAAVVCYRDDYLIKKSPEATGAAGLWPRPDELERITFGFNLSYSQGESLREALDRGDRIVFHAKVEGTGIEPYFMDVVEARIRGSEQPEQELVFIAHLDHPKQSANDNASGSAAMLDIARALHRLITSGDLPSPKRTLRFLWVPEWFGTMAYIDRHPELIGPELGGKVLASVNLDMVGEHLELLHTQLLLSRAPSSVPSVLNDVAANMALMVDGMRVRTPRGSQSAFNYRVIPFLANSDHMMMVDRKIPAIMLGHPYDHTWHTSADTPDMVDPVELERSELIASGVLWYLANLDERQLIDLVALVTANGMQRIAHAGMAGSAHIQQAEPDEVEQALAEAINKLAHVSRWQTEILRSAWRFAGVEESKTIIDDSSAAFRSAQELALALLRAQARAMGCTTEAPDLTRTKDNRVPRRLTRGPIFPDLAALGLCDERAAWHEQEGAALDFHARLELLNFANGTRSVTEIRDAVSAEYEPVATELVSRFFDDLAEVGVVEWQR
jgi:hypothetical protein